MRTHLERQLRQGSLTKSLENRSERRRKDIWWVSQNGNDAEEVANDISAAFRQHGVKWLNDASNLHLAIQEIERERDCLHKYTRAHHVAKALGDDQRASYYAQLEHAERDRIEQGLPFLQGRNLRKG